MIYYVLTAKYKRNIHSQVYWFSREISNTNKVVFQRKYYRENSYNFVVQLLSFYKFLLILQNSILQDRVQGESELKPYHPLILIQDHPCEVSQKSKLQIYLWRNHLTNKYIKLFLPPH